MKTEVKNVETYRKHLNVEVPHEEVLPYLDKAFLKYQKKVKVDGFRPGKVPLSIIKQRYGKAIEADVADDLVQQFYTKSLENESIVPVAPGKILEMHYEEGQPLTFKAEVEIEPEITVKDYKGIKVEKETVPVADTDIQSMLSYLQEQHAERKTLTGGAEKGSLLEADIQALDNTGFPVVGQKWEKRIVELGMPPFDGEVEDHLAGVKPGEERRIIITAPPQEGQTEPAPEQHYALHVHQVFEKVLPELNDEFAKKLGEYENLEALKKQLRENLEAQRAQDAEKQLRGKISQEIVKRNDYTLPPSQVEYTLESMFEEEMKRSQGNINKDQFLQHQRPVVIWGIKWDRIWHKIAETEAVEVTDEMIEAEIDKMVEGHPEQEKRIRAQFKAAAARDRIREHLLEDEVYDFLKSEARIKEVTVKPDKKKKSSIITP